MPNRNVVHAVTVHHNTEVLEVQLLNGRAMSVPLSWFPQLAKTTVTQRRDFTIVRDGEWLPIVESVDKV